MGWKLTENKAANTYQELQVKNLLKEMAANTYATYAEAFEFHFKNLVKDIPKSNALSAEQIFKITPRNTKSVEVWKLDTKGDFKCKMFTLEYASH